MTLSKKPDTRLCIYFCLVFQSIQCIQGINTAKMAKFVSILIKKYFLFYYVVHVVAKYYIVVFLLYYVLFRGIYQSKHSAKVLH